MNPASTREFRDNRAKFTLADLQPYADQWMAFSTDGRRIVASGSGIADIAKKLEAAKLKLHEVVFDHIVIDSDTYVGGAEVM